MMTILILTILLKQIIRLPGPCGPFRPAGRAAPVTRRYHALWPTQAATVTESTRRVAGPTVTVNLTQPEGSIMISDFQ